MNLEFTIPLVPRTKKNSQEMHRGKGGKLHPAPSKAFTAWQTAAGWYIQHKHEKINTPVNIKCVFYMDTLGVVDIVGLLQATDDALTHYGVIQDDNSKIVVSHDGSRVKYDKENPRTEIEITEVEP